MIDHELHKGILAEWHKAGKLTRAHVGEYGPAENILAMLPVVTNIAHGIKIADYPDLAREAKDSEIYFDLGLTSNKWTGVANILHHPVVKMVKMGLKVTLGTDDPAVCNTSLSGEYAVALETGITPIELETIKKNAQEMIGKYFVAPKDTKTPSDTTK
jgi:adenosine deaminase